LQKLREVFRDQFKDVVRDVEVKAESLTSKESEQDENVDDSMDGKVSEGSDVMRCALGLILYKLGLNFYESEEPSQAYAHLEKALQLIDSLPFGLKIRHLNSVQDLYNHIAIILSDRDKSKEALNYLDKAQEIYLFVKEHTTDMPQRRLINNFDLYLLKQCHAHSQDKQFTFYINQGLDLKELETKYTTSLFILAQVHSKLNNVEQGMKYCGLTLKRQLSQGAYDLKDWVVNSTTLADAFLAKDHLSQAEYLLYAAYHVLPEDPEKKKGLRAMV
jgi:tetratricopeptide (TPR) repeat protein